jgi:hypothetical protein
MLANKPVSLLKSVVLKKAKAKKKAKKVTKKARKTNRKK